ncbi:MAG: D-sedoheptulose 7-phosphate isomerase [Nitrospirota bacterium]|jgi:D-sedoheptulose 7-phosphate isomerase
MDRAAEAIRESIELKRKVLDDRALMAELALATEAIIKTLKAGGKVLLCGNGGSAADAQHLAAEFSGRFYFDRPPLFAEALHVNTSYLTAVANDYSFDEVFARQVRAKGARGDVLVGLSTSGNSPNVLRALDEARDLGMTTVGLTGEGGGKMKGRCNHLIAVPSKDTPRIQEVHITLGHVICELVEAALFERK